MAIFKLSIHLHVDASKSQEKLTKLFVIVGRVQAFEHLPYNGLIPQSPAVGIQDQLSLLVWWEGDHNCLLMTQTKETQTAFLFDMAKPLLCADFPSSEYCAAIIKNDL